MTYRKPRTKTAGQAMRQVNCPVTCGRPTRMTEEGFARICAHHQAEADKPFGPSGSSTAYDRICRRCQGKKRPPELEIIDLKEMEGATMTTKRRSGKCDVCGKKANIRKYSGMDVCATCETIVRAAKNNPEKAVRLIGEFHGDKYFPQLAEESKLLDVIARIREALGVGGEPMLDELPEIVSRLKAQYDQAAHDASRFGTFLLEIKAALGVDAAEKGSVLPGIIKTMYRNLEQAHDNNAALEKSHVKVRRVLEAEDSDSLLDVAKRRMVMLNKLDQLYNEAMEELDRYRSADAVGCDVAFQAPDGYQSLASVLADAVEQAASGKGKERHAKAGEPFEQQKICEITRRVGVGFPLGQAIKKAVEAPRLGDRAQSELLGAINYLAAAVLIMREERRSGQAENLITMAELGAEAA